MPAPTLVSAMFAAVVEVIVPEKFVDVSSRPMVMTRAVAVVLVTLPAPVIDPQVGLPLTSKIAPASMVIAERIGISDPLFMIRRPALIQVVPA